VDTVAQTGLCDTTPPDYDSFTALSDGADPAISDVGVEIDIRLWDDVAGVSHGDCDLKGPNSIDRTLYLSWANRISGDAMDGTYQITTTIPQYSPAGQWTLNCRAYDYADNGVDLAPITLQID
jgi:hypothetical protein